MDEHTLNDLLECSVCLDRLDTTSKVLPCQHTFCRKCLEVIISSHSELRCPECRILVDTKIGDLPPNVLLMRILEGMKNASTTFANNRQQTENPCKRIDSQSNSDNPILISTEAATNNSHSINANENVAAVTAAATAAANSLALRESLSRKTTHNNQENSPRVDQQQQQQQQQQIAKRIEQSNVIRSTNSVRQPLQNNSSNKQMSQNIASLPTPTAKALYDFESKESGDLSFKKGDMIALLRRIDVNWFVGECNGREGVFPVNYVQVLVPLPQPQCKALYDFKMGPNEEEGCLTFKKGAIINVLRRVDQNWAEGRVADTIGIFPIQFVEMNSLAKYVIDASSKYIFSGRRIVPATPNEQNNKHNGFSSDTSSTTMTTTSPNSSTTSNTSSNSSTAPNSPLTHSQPTTVQNASHTSAPNDNRFLLNSSGAGNTNSVASNGMSKNRHSKEIVMQPNAKIKPISQKHSSSKSAQNDSTYNNQATKSSSSKPSSNGSSHRLRQISPSASSVPSNAFVALYPYKPQKSDELELKKGSVYYVKERCQDGWFRGTNRSQKSGVFPGNYVAPLRNSGSRNDGSGSGQPTNTGAISNNQKRSHGNNSNSNQTNAAPKLPPRSSGSTGSVWSKPIGQHVEALFGRSQSSLIKRITNIKRSKSPVVNQSVPSYSMDNPVFEDNTIGCVESANLPTTTNTKRNTIHLSHPVHVRSGSCPSQLLQSLPIEININSVSNTSGMISKTDLFSSQRFKGHRERPTLQALRQNMEAANGRSKNGESSLSYHRKSQSLDAATIAEQIANCSTVEANVKRKSHTHNEKFKCIVSYPPNSEFELELMVGDIVFVHKKRENGWYKGTHARTGKIGLFPSSFVEPDI